MYIVIALIIGMIVGCLFSKLKSKNNNIGYLRIDTSQEEPYLFLELTTDISKISNKAIVNMTVNYKNFDTQK